MYALNITEYSASQQAALIRAWALASAILTWDVRADMSVAALQKLFIPLQKMLSCSSCREEVSARVQDAMEECAMVEVSYGIYLDACDLKIVF